jgi:hypothetical protein
MFSNSEYYPLRPSTTLRVLNALLHLSALLTVIFTTMPIVLTVLVSALAASSYAYWLLKKTPQLLIVANNELRFIGDKNENWEAQTLMPTVVSDYVIFFSSQALGAPRKSYHAIFFDSMTTENFRRLRVVLRLEN